MSEINSEIRWINHKRHLILGSLLMGLCLICILMTIMFLYVSNTANQRVEEIRLDYRNIADRRDAKVDQLSSEVAALQHKLDALPDRTASKTADVVKQAVKQDETPARQ